MTHKLTKRQKDVYGFLRETIARHGYGPTVREIGAHFGIKSPNGVMCHLYALRWKGFITWIPYTRRTIKLVHNTGSLIEFMRAEADMLEPDERLLFVSKILVAFKGELQQLAQDQASASKDGPELEAGAAIEGATADATN